MKSKLVSLDEALAPIQSGCTIALGGALLRRHPNAAVRALIRNGVKDLTVLGWVTTTAVELLAAAGALRRYEGAYAGMFSYGLAPCFRRGVESGEIEVGDFSESTIIARYRAAAANLPFYPTTALLGSDIARLNPDQFKTIECPFTQRLLHAVAPAHADFTIIHGYASDEFGNVQWPVVRDSDDIDQLMASAAKRLIVSVEKIIPHSEVRKQPSLTYIPSHWVEAVVEVPFGAHPVACDTVYNEDHEHLRRYMASGIDNGEVQGYLDEFVNSIASHDDYLAKIGRARLDQLAAEVAAND
ncbi:Glutaconate CoA-transferase subunit A [compost metagenome]